jgi:uncharacterized damage-inducible protein DinB
MSWNVPSMQEYNETVADPLVELSFRHMAWANFQMLTLLRGLPDQALHFSAWNHDWSVGKLAHHIVISGGRLIYRITGQPAPTEPQPPQSSIEIDRLIEVCAKSDARLLTLAQDEGSVQKYVRFGKTAEFQKATLLVQAVHHATEHRAQISDILAANDMDVLNLDEIDLWSFERWEKSQ